VHYAPFLDRTTHTEDAVLPGRVDNILIIVSQCTCYIRQACHALVTVDHGVEEVDNYYIGMFSTIHDVL